MHALLIYAALGVAIGLVAWAVFVHGGSGSALTSKERGTLQRGTK
jgi:hypothetical protein